MKEKVSLFGLKKVFGNKLHLEVMRGSLTQNEDYCSKEGVLTEFGKIPRQGFRTDIQAALKMVRDKKTELEVFEEYPCVMLRMNCGMRHYRRLVEERQRSANRDVHVIVLWGPTGTGKSHTAMQFNPYKIQGYDLQANNGTGWWDGYAGQTTLLIDEYHNDVRIGYLQKLLDKYVCRLPTKGCFTYAAWTTVYITTNLERDAWHEKATQLQRDALFRRINTWTEMNEPYEPVRSARMNTGATSSGVQSSSSSGAQTWTNLCESVNTEYDL